MGPTLFEIARTLAFGRVAGTVKAAASFDALPVPHAADEQGRPLLLARTGSGVDRDLAGLARRQVPVVLTVDDHPPLPGSPSLGRVRVTGLPVRLDPVAGRAAAHAFARANPVADLLDVGVSAALYRVEVQQVRVRHQHTWHVLDNAGYAAGEPDPLHEDEQHLLADLAGHHAAEIGAYLRTRLAAAGTPVKRAVPMRLDRYGFTVATGAGVWHRVDFPAPVGDAGELSTLLHGVLFHGDL
ncbi:DUF2470 domain-containing protein [Dactylosporangium sp. CS-033363]|uniref:DUF2470 domain-containing protein n=1 Tax=Dactylosporangium sp. CS-033363 TaxID=3239935 RepID=UPI003D8DAEB0